MSHLRVTRMQFAPAEFRSWKRGDHEMLTQSRASEYLKRVLVDKPRNRQGTPRFSANPSWHHMFATPEVIAARRACAGPRRDRRIGQTLTVIRHGARFEAISVRSGFGALGYVD